MLVWRFLLACGVSQGGTADSTTTTTTTTIGPPLLSSPLYNTAEVVNIASRFRFPAEEAQYGYHSGIDVVFVASAGGSIKSSCSGEVTEIATASSHADPTIDIFVTPSNDDYRIMYCFEPLEERYVSVGAYVEVGQLIGKIGSWEEGDYGPVLHFQIDHNSSPECPMTFLDQATRQEFQYFYSLNSAEGLVDPCHQHPAGCPSLHDLW